MTEPSQNMQALALANKTRLGRADLKRKVRSGEMTVAEVAEHPMARTMTVIELLRSQHRWGTQRAVRWLQDHDMHQLRACKDLTERQLGQLASINE